jgi:hypothetical protein
MCNTISVTLVQGRTSTEHVLIKYAAVNEGVHFCPASFTCKSYISLTCKYGHTDKFCLRTTALEELDKTGGMY